MMAENRIAARKCYGQAVASEGQRASVKNNWGCGPLIAITDYRIGAM